MSVGALIGAISQGLIWGVMVLGVYITYKVLDVADLTVDGSLATGGATFAVFVLQGVDPTLCLFISIIAGGLCGLATGILITKFKIPAILAGILTQLGLYSVNLRILSNKANVSISKITTANSVGNNTTKELLTNISYIAKKFSLTNGQASMIVGLIVVIICIIFLYILFGTEIGATIRATGNNEQMIRALGVDTDKTKLYGIILSNMLIGLSGALLVQMNKYTDVSMGKGAIVYALASIVIGDVLFRKFRNFAVKLISSVVGCILFFFIRAFVINNGLQPNDMQLFSSLIVAVALCAPIVKEQYNIKKQYKKNTPSKIKGGV